MLYKVSQLKKELALFESSDVLYVMFWAKYEFEDNFENKKITNRMWYQALENLDSESEEQIIKESIENEIQYQLDEKENE
jgi:hypothetical protein